MKHEAGKGENLMEWTAELKTDVSDQEKTVKKITSPNSGGVIRAGERESEEPADTAPEIIIREKRLLTLRQKKILRMVAELQ